MCGSMADIQSAMAEIRRGKKKKKKPQGKNIMVCPMPQGDHKKPQTDGAKNRTFRSSLRAVKIHSLSSSTQLVHYYYYNYFMALFPGPPG